ncbi:MAG: hypothetical protein R3F11_24150 [Verrucomicrobiales bacterium]
MNSTASTALCYLAAAVLGGSTARWWWPARAAETPAAQDRASGSAAAADSELESDAGGEASLGIAPGAAELTAWLRSGDYSKNLVALAKWNPDAAFQLAVDQGDEELIGKVAAEWASSDARRAAQAMKPLPGDLIHRIIGVVAGQAFSNNPQQIGELLPLGKLAQWPGEARMQVLVGGLWGHPEETIQAMQGLEPKLREEAEGRILTSLYPQGVVESLLSRVEVGDWFDQTSYFSRSFMGPTIRFCDPEEALARIKAMPLKRNRQIMLGHFAMQLSLLGDPRKARQLLQDELLPLEDRRAILPEVMHGIGMAEREIDWAWLDSMPDLIGEADKAEYLVEIGLSGSAEQRFAALAAVIEIIPEEGELPDAVGLLVGLSLNSALKLDDPVGWAMGEIPNERVREQALVHIASQMKDADPLGALEIIQGADDGGQKDEIRKSVAVAMVDQPDQAITIAGGISDPTIRKAAIDSVLEQSWGVADPGELARLLRDASLPPGDIAELSQRWGLPNNPNLQ